ncbi:hypothetical protein ACWC24_10870 [Streptomyces sp. NPDC001443]
MTNTRGECSVLKRRIALSSCVASSALILGVLSATPASASNVFVSCSTTGANGDVSVSNFDGATDTIVLSLGARDTSADGHHVRVRLITKNQAGTIKYWAWHANYNGAGSTQSWDTYAHDESGIFDVGVQAARFEGDTLLNSCTKWN